jgi:hypothetical protein
LINSTQQVGGSIGTALLNTIATTVTVGYLHAHGVASGSPASAATVAAGTVHGFSVAFALAAAILGLALLTVAISINAPVGAGGGGELAGAERVGAGDFSEPAALEPA